MVYLVRLMNWANCRQPVTHGVVYSVAHNAAECPAEYRRVTRRVAQSSAEYRRLRVLGQRTAGACPRVPTFCPPKPFFFILHEPLQVGRGFRTP